MNDKLVSGAEAPLGPRLRHLRTLKNLSLNDLAGLAGTSAPALHRYESGWDRFELRTLRRLARALDARMVISLEPLRKAESEPPDSDAELVARLRPLFWDVDMTVNHLVENPAWLLRRVVQFGDWHAVHQVRRRFGDALLWEAVQHRSTDPRTRRFWEVVLRREGERT